MEPMYCAIVSIAALPHSRNSSGDGSRLFIPASSEFGIRNSNFKFPQEGRWKPPFRFRLRLPLSAPNFEGIAGYD